MNTLASSWSCDRSQSFYHNTRLPGAKLMARNADFTAWNAISLRLVWKLCKENLYSFEQCCYLLCEIDLKVIKELSLSLPFHWWHGISIIQDEKTTDSNRSVSQKWEKIVEVQENYLKAKVQCIAVYSKNKKETLLRYIKMALENHGEDILLEKTPGCYNTMQGREWVNNREWQWRKVVSLSLIQLFNF